MMKLWLQSAGRRRGSSILDGAVDKSPSTLLWTALHLICCLISLLLGFRFSRLIYFLLLSSPSANTSTIINSIALFEYTSNPFAKSSGDGTLASSIGILANKTFSNGVVSPSKVVVGRHGIKIRPWPHPNPDEVIQAHRILDRVQLEQRIQFGVKEPKPLIVVTPTYARTFQTLHLTSLMHSLMNCPYDLTWIVVEAGGKTDETAALIEKSGIQTIHIGFDRQMPATWADRQKMENLMRLSALRAIRERRLDGIIMFADDSNLHSMELFDEVQKVKAIGAVSVGILMHAGGVNDSVPVQAPACNSSENTISWHGLDSSSYGEKSALYVGDMGPVLPMKLEWAGFALNSRLVWTDEGDRPEWMKDLEILEENEVESPLSLVKDGGVVEALGGGCGSRVLVWWMRAEARSDSTFPPRWKIEAWDEDEVVKLPLKNRAVSERRRELVAN